MISKISFGSTYNVSSKLNDYKKVNEFRNYVSHDSLNAIGVSFSDSIDNEEPINYKSSCTAVIPDEMDDRVETYCAAKGIAYKKISHNLVEDVLTLRTAPTPNGMIRANINVDKLESLIQNQQGNIADCEYCYNKYFKKDLDFILKSGDKIPVTTLSIIDRCNKGNVEDTLNYIKKYGADNLNPNQLFVDFCQRTDKPDHTMYFALKNCGIKNVPMYMDLNTYRIATALGILKA